MGDSGTVPGPTVLSEVEDTSEGLEGRPTRDPKCREKRQTSDVRRTKTQSDGRDGWQWESRP